METNLINEGLPDSLEPANSTIFIEGVRGYTLNELSDWFHGAPIGLHISGQDGTIERTNLAELELLGYSDHSAEYVGHNLAEFHADSDAARTLLDRLIAGELITEHEATLLRRDGRPQRVLLYANARILDGHFCGVRCYTFPHPEDLRPDISEIGGLGDQSVESRRLNLTEEQERKLYWELQDFFDNGPVGVHMVGGDGLIKRANKAEFAAMGYDPEVYLGAPVARFHADQAIIEEMFEDLVCGRPLVNVRTSLFHQDGSKFPVMIYSNSRMSEGAFLNTRCFTVPVPKAYKASTGDAMRFRWPRNEDIGLTVPAMEGTAPESQPNPMTLAFKYIVSRRGLEESLGFLARISQVLGSIGSFDAMAQHTVTLSVPYLADFASIDLAAGHLAHASTANLQDRVDRIVRHFSDDGPRAKFGAESVPGYGEVEVCFDLAMVRGASGERAAHLLNMGIRSMIVAPLQIRGQRVGTLHLLRENLPSRRNFGPADRALAEELARRISFAVEIERLSAHVSTPLAN